MYKMNIYKDMIKCNNEKTILLSKKIKYIVVLLISHYVITLISVVFMVFIDLILVKFFGFSSILKSRIKSNYTIEYYGIYYGVFIMCIGGPFIEEVCFRLLLSLSKIHVGTSLAVLFYYFSGPTWTLDSYSYLIIRLFIYIVIFSICYNFWNIYWVSKLFKYKLLIISAILFGLIHVMNFYPLQYSVLYLYPFYVIPQMSVGVMLGVLRVKFGFIWGVIFHIIVNVSSSLEYVYMFF
ncbi:CPBP family glutamic-type intramembrane protease [Larkinella harenae]